MLADEKTKPIAVLLMAAAVISMMGGLRICSDAQAKTPWEIVKLTDNTYADDDPQIFGSNITWHIHDGNDFEIFFYNGDSITQLTNNNYHDVSPQIYGSNVVWYGHDGSDYEIFFYDGVSITQLTNDSYNDRYPQISGTNIVWQGDDGSDWEIFLYDGSTTTQLTNNDYDDEYPQVSGSNVVWYGDDGNDTEIFLYDGVSTTQLTDNIYYDVKPQVSGSNVVWYGSDGNDGEIFFYNGTTTIQLTNNDDEYNDIAPKISGSNVVWLTEYDDFIDIFFYDGVSITQLTNYSQIFNPQIFGSKAVWQAPTGGTGRPDIALYNGTIINLTPYGNNGYKPQIYGSKIVWSGYNGDDDAEIYFLSIPVFVDSNATSGAQNGSSWEDAYLYLQDALANAETGNDVFVAEGTYRPDESSSEPNGTDDRTATFQLIDGVGIYGGFPAGGGSRDTNQYETILSGDIGIEGDANDDSYHIVTGSGVDSTAVLDGFVITGGDANGTYLDGRGGGMYNYQGSPTVANCTFIENRAKYFGGGMFNSDCNPNITNCHFIANISNSAGGIFNQLDCNPTIINCSFLGNIVTHQGGGIYNSGTSGNYGYPVLINCIFNGNYAGQTGGGMDNVYSSPTLINCSFSNNEAGQGGNGGGAIRNHSNTIVLSNCILWGNSAGGSTGESDQIYSWDSTVTVNYTCIQGLTGALGGTGNIGDDPLFKDADGPDDIAGTADDNLELGYDSPCIDAGDNTMVPVEVTTDLAGNARFTDDPIIYDTGNGTPPIVDMGAYERYEFCDGVTYPYPTGDLNHDCLVDFYDFTIMAANWLLYVGPE